MWLDRGELGKIIDRADTPARGAPAGAEHEPRQEHYGKPQEHRGKPYRKQREGFLGELFDLWAAGIGC